MKPKRKVREVRELTVVRQADLSRKCALGREAIVIPFCLCQTEFKVGDRVRVTVERTKPRKRGGR